MVQFYNFDGGNWRITENCVFPSAKTKQKQTKSREPPCTKLIGFFCVCVYVWVCVCVFNISPLVATVSPSSVSTKWKHSHRAYFVIYNHIDFIWKKVYIKGISKERRTGCIQKGKSQTWTAAGVITICFQRAIMCHSLPGASVPGSPAGPVTSADDRPSHWIVCRWLGRHNLTKSLEDVSSVIISGRKESKSKERS